MGWLTQLALDASIWPLPPPLECVWEILDQRSQRCPISPYWRSRMRSGGKKPSKKGGFLAISWFFFAHGTFQRLLVVSIAYQNFWHKILGRLRPLPTMCGALGSHRIEKTAKKSAQIPPFWWIITIPLHFGELGGVLATFTIKKVTFRIARGTSGKIFMAPGPQRRSTRGQGAKKRQKEVGLFSHFRVFFAPETFQCLLLVSIAYHNFWHKISGRLRPLPTMCGALGSHRVEITWKKHCLFWWT